MKELDITQWTKVGEGGNGATYINPAEPGVLLKESYLELAKADDLVQEFNISKAIYGLGVPTPRMLELVSVNGRAAIKCQAIEGKKSFAKLCHDNPEHLDDYALQMATLAKKLHATGTAGTKAIPSMKTLMTEASFSAAQGAASSPRSSCLRICVCLKPGSRTSFCTMCSETWSAAALLRRFGKAMRKRF